ncbi:MAG: hypothetical protein N3I86_11055 [Verrucomicrobiae bacterium]|nr:hypothetical protein [Verrucomicrobiae bacterium]
MTMNRWNLKTALALPAVYYPAQPVWRCRRARHHPGGQQSRDLFAVENTVFALIMAVSMLGAAGCFWWVWQ